MHELCYLGSVCHLKQDLVEVDGGRATSDVAVEEGVPPHDLSLCTGGKDTKDLRIGLERTQHVSGLLGEIVGVLDLRRDDEDLGTHKIEDTTSDCASGFIS